ncbi:MAG TPA: hypothetical protein VEK07_21275 [Polyangiaceae bacterium]|nr:hypothetical protein [Polyangiaceae bacterium]
MDPHRQRIFVAGSPPQVPAPQLASAFEGFGAAFFTAAVFEGVAFAAGGDGAAGDGVGPVEAGAEAAGAAAAAAGRDAEPMVAAGEAGAVTGGAAFGAAGVAVETTVPVADVAGDVAGEAPTCPPHPFAEHDACPAPGVEVDGVTSFAWTGCWVAPPQPTIALAPSAVSEAAKCSSERTGRIVGQPPPGKNTRLSIRRYGHRAGVVADGARAERRPSRRKPADRKWPASNQIW